MKVEPQFNAKKNRIINYRPLFEFAIGLMLGIAVCAELNAYGILCLAIICIIGIASGLFILKSYRTALFMVAVLMSCNLVRMHTPPCLEVGSYLVSGTVESVDKPNSYGKREVIVVNASVSRREYSGKICIQTSSKREVKIGDVINAYVRVNADLIEKDGEDSFDKHKYYLSRSIGVFCVAKDFTIMESGKLPLQRIRGAIRESFENKANELFGSDSDTAITLLMGSTEAMPDERKDLYRKAGISHILAISGFHMSIIVSIIGKTLPKHKRWLRISIIGIVMLIYCILCVQSPGIIRSAVMTFAMLVSSALERREDGLSAISIAVIVILMVNPYQLYSISFQLSFAACFGIITLGASITRYIKRIGEVPKLGLSTSVSASTATIMLQMRYFGTISTYTLLANLIAVPIFSLILPLMLFVQILGYVFPAFAYILAYIPRSLLFINDKFISAVANMPYSVLEFRVPSVYACIVFLIGLFISSEYILRPIHKRIEYLFVLILLFTICVLAGIM